MSKVNVEEFDACHRFMSDYVQFILLLAERKYVQLTHNVASENVVIFVNYDKNNLEIRLRNLSDILSKNYKKVTFPGT